MSKALPGRRATRSFTVLHVNTMSTVDEVSSTPCSLSTFHRRRPSAGDGGRTVELGVCSSSPNARSFPSRRLTCGQVTASCDSSFSRDVARNQSRKRSSRTKSARFPFLSSRARARECCSPCASCHGCHVDTAWATLERASCPPPRALSPRARPRARASRARLGDARAVPPRPSSSRAPLPMTMARRPSTSRRSRSAWIGSSARKPPARPARCR